MNRDLEHLFVLLKHLARGRSGQVRCVSFSPCGVGMHIRPQDLHCSSLRRGRRGIFFVLMSDWKKKTCLFGRQPRPPGVIGYSIRQSLVDQRDLLTRSTFDSITIHQWEWGCSRSFRSVQFRLRLTDRIKAERSK